MPLKLGMRVVKAIPTKSFWLLWFLAFYWLFRAIRNRTEVVWRGTKRIALLLEHCSFLRDGYEPTPWLLVDHYGHLMTALVNLTQRLFTPKPTYKRRLLTLPDGGTVGLDWVKEEEIKKDPSIQGEKPFLLVMHGLCGDAESPYIVPLVRKATQDGYQVVVMVARGCGGVRLTSDVTFNAARTQDFASTVTHFREKFPERRIFAVGYSLGAGILAKYVGEQGDRCPLAGAACVSISFDFTKTTPHFWVWSRLKLVFDLKRYVRQNKSELKKNPKINLCKILNSVNVREFDSHAVVPTNGYRDVDEYYRDASAVKVAHSMMTPTLAFVAEDDPVCCATGAPMNSAALGPGLIIVKTSYGGHVAFGKGWVPYKESWADAAALQFFSVILKENL
ncbi:hypothetical protein AAMO2058_001429200 [Amorphochlora amoebiformis]